MNLVRPDVQSLVRRAKQRALCDLKGVGQNLQRRRVPVEMANNSVLEPAIGQGVLHAVREPDDMRAYKFCSADVRDVKFGRRPNIHDIPNKFHDYAPPVHSPPQAWARKRKLVSRPSQSHFVAHSVAGLTNNRQQKVGRYFAVREAFSYAVNHGAHVAISAVATQIKNPMSPAISIIASVCDRNIAANSWEANENIPKFLGNVDFKELFESA